VRQFSITASLVLVWFLIALALDRLILSRYCLPCANAVALELSIKVPAAELVIPPISLLVLVLLPMFVLAIMMIPWHNLRVAHSWKEAFATWCQPWFWMGFAVILAVLGESLFSLSKEYLPQAFVELADKFRVTGTISVAVAGYKETKPLALSASLSGLIGLCIGSYLFLKNGVNAIFKWPKS
jgi:hypothetical protein